MKPNYLLPVPRSEIPKTDILPNFQSVSGDKTCCAEAVILIVLTIIKNMANSLMALRSIMLPKV